MNEENSSLENPILHKLQEKFPQSIIASKSYRNEVTVTVNKGDILSICQFLKNDQTLQYNYLSDLCGVDNVGQQPRFEVVYHLYSLINNRRLRVKAPVDEDDCSIDSVSKIWATANWHEREAYDMYGIIFKSHPNLRRILNPDEFEGHPLRKDFPLKGLRADKSKLPTV